jgi:hypothetical protein
VEQFLVIRKPSRYNVDKQKWLLWDSIPTCKKKEVTCYKCGHPGHFAYTLVANEKKAKISDIDGKLWLHYLVKVMCNHAHYVEDIDVGRHVECPAGQFYIDERKCVTSVRLNPAKVPDWVYGDMSE